MKIFKKVKQQNGLRQIYLLGIKLFSYRKKKVKSLNVQKTTYGNIYFPHYNSIVMPSNKEPEIYNRDGQRMRTFFLRDTHMSHAPTCPSQYFMWDKFNIGLDVHFYSHYSMLETMGHPKYKFGFLIETEGIVPNDYKIFDQNPDLAKEFELIFTSSKKILDNVPNARFVPITCSLYDGSFAPSDAYKRKNKLISILSSNKLMCPLHEFRYNLAHKCKNENLCDTFGTFDGGPFVSNIDQTLRDYCFSICIENYQAPYLFT